MAAQATLAVRALLRGGGEDGDFREFAALLLRLIDGHALGLGQHGIGCSREG